MRYQGGFAHPAKNPLYEFAVGFWKSAFHTGLCVLAEWGFRRTAWNDQIDPDIELRKLQCQRFRESIDGSFTGRINSQQWMRLVCRG